MKKKMMLPIGIENFEEIRTQGFYYVDKTGMIRDLLNDWSKVTLFTRPRRFGKSLNMSMFQSFFEIGANPSLFDGLEIAKEQKLCDEYLGKYPVISISLKSIEGTNFDDARAMCVRIISTEVMRHKSVLLSDKLDSHEKRKYEKLLQDDYSNDMLKDSLWVIAESLYKVYNQKVIILIDEYDVPLAKAYNHNYYDDMAELIRGLFERTLKTNQYLQIAVLTGCMRIVKESIFTGLNNLNVISLTNAYFDKYFGFTDHEVADMLSYYGMESQYPIVKAWYDGYTFGKQAVYCPWDVLKYIFDHQKNPDMPPQNYWSNTSSNDIIRRFLNKATITTRKELENLIEGHSIEKNIYQELTYAELDKTIDHLWGVLFTTGYLTYELSAITSAHNSNTLKLKIPNEEIRSIFKEQILSWFNDEVENNTERYTDFCQAFIDGNTPKIQKMFNDYLHDMISIRDSSVRKSMKENFYHGMLLGILNFRTDWYISSNREAGDGYNDILIAHERAGIGMILEVKYAENDNLDLECANALTQIEKLHYINALSEFEVNKVYKYAIACYKKHCKVTMTEETWPK